MSVTSPESRPAADSGELRRVISRPILTFFILGDILGAGIYTLTGQVGGDVGGAIWASFLVAFLLAFLTAFAYMELVTKYPQAAGGALYCDRAYKIKFLSFLVTFAIMASGVTSATFAASRVGGNYFTGLTGVENPPMVLIGIVAILLVAAINLWGVAESLRVNVVITIIELSGLLFIIGVGGFVLAGGDGNPAQAFDFAGTGFGVVTGVLAGAATAFYAFLGFEDSVNLAEETHEPSKTFPPAMITALVLAGIVYLLVAFTAAMTVPLDVLTESSGPLLEIVRLGAPDLPAERVFSAVSMIAVSNTMLINMLMASRLLYGMANRGVLPGRVRPHLAAAHAVGGDPVHHRAVGAAAHHGRRPERPVRHHRAAADRRVPAGQLSRRCGCAASRSSTTTSRPRRRPSCWAPSCRRSSCCRSSGTRRSTCWRPGSSSAASCCSASTGSSSATASRPASSPLSPANPDRTRPGWPLPPA